jgi:hypothetical protein
MMIGPAEIGLLPAFGEDPVTVRRKPRVSVVSTGDELVEPNEPLTAGKIRDSNRFSLIAALTEAGAEVIWSGKGPDERDHLETLLQERIAESELAAAAARRAERLSNLHWKLVYLREHPDWRGEGVVVAKEERKDVVLIPDLALETRLRLKGEPGLDSRFRVALRGVDIPSQTVDFRLLD